MVAKLKQQTANMDLGSSSSKIIDGSKTPYGALYLNHSSSSSKIIDGSKTTTCSINCDNSSSSSKIIDGSKTVFSNCL